MLDGMNMNLDKHELGQLVYTQLNAINMHWQHCKLKSDYRHEIAIQFTWKSE